MFYLLSQIKKKYDQWRGKPDTDNYFLKDYSEEGIAFLKSQLIKNAFVWCFGLFTSRTASITYVKPVHNVVSVDCFYP